MAKKNYLSILNRKAKTDPEIAEALSFLKDYKTEMENLRDDLVIENIRLRKGVETAKKLTSFYRHEAITPLNAIYLGLQMLSSDSNNLNETQEKSLEYINQATEKAIALTDFLSNEIIGEPQKFVLEDLVQKNISRQDEFIRKNKIGLNFRYNFNEIENNKNVIDGVIGTVLDDAYCWTPEYSRIEVGIRKDKGNKTELLIENKIGPEKRNGCGEGKGIGQKTARGLTERLGGEFQNYSKSEVAYNAMRNRYETMKSIGNERATDNISIDDEVWGVKIRI